MGRVGNSPPSLQDNWLRIPRELRERPQWCIAGPDKSPRTPTGSHASVSDPSTWTDFNTACHAARERGRHIGYMLTTGDPFCVIDFDLCNEESQRRKGQPI